MTPPRATRGARNARGAAAAAEERAAGSLSPVQRARILAAAQNAPGRERYAAAAIGQADAALIAAGRSVPAWISMALNVGGHEGPQVDLACGTWEGNPDGDVDMWEAGSAVPSGEQVQLLAGLTGYPVAFFYRSFEPGPLLGGQVWICSRRKINGRRCTPVGPDWIDERGVLHYGADEPYVAGAPVVVKPVGPVQGALF